MTTTTTARAITLPILIIATLAQSSCDPVEPAVPDPLRCTEYSGRALSVDEERELWACCYEAGASDCEQGFVPLQALHGPEQMPLQEDNEFFWTLCQRITSSASDQYCQGYCNSCPAYVGDPDLAWNWTSSEDQDDKDLSMNRECYCQTYK